MPLELVEALHQETLAQQLIARLKAQASHENLLKPICVTVQNAGLGRWLQLWQAKQFGISAGLALPFARGCITDILEKAGCYNRRKALEPETLQWLVFQQLTERVFENWGRDGAPLRDYLASGRDTLEKRCWQLARQMADLYDRYAVFRPDWLRAWLRGEGELSSLRHWNWQARLLRAVTQSLDLSTDEMETRLFGLALNAFCENPAGAKPSSDPIHVFGVSSFPPVFLRFFHRLAQTQPVSLYHLAPSAVFLGEDFPKNYRSALALLGQGEATPSHIPEELHNPLLIANGQAAARFQSLLLALDFQIGDMPEFDLETDPTDLSLLQRSLRLNEPCLASFLADGTISFHSCHSRLREVQVLQQQLLALFAADPELRPEEILVLTPEISDYADAIDAVFAIGARAGENGSPVRIPYCVADRLHSENASCWRFFETFLELLQGRQTFSQIASLLDFDPVCQRLQIDQQEMQELLSLLQDVGIRWGINGQARESQGQPRFEEYSWEYGLQRLYDGLILPIEGPTDRSPYATDSRLAAIVGNLTQLLRPIFAFINRPARSQSFAAWSDELLGLLKTVLGEQRDSGDWLRSIALGIGKIKNVSNASPISFDTVCEILADLQGSPTGPSGLLRRGITFCRLQPMRHIPAKVICVLGMDEGQFPRLDRSSEFDLMDAQRRQARELRGGPYAYQELHYLGDSRLRDEDRQIFLDCILNARQRLYFSYVGQSIQNNAAIPPSLLISELQQFLKRPNRESAESPEDRSAQVALVCLQHPLQEWSRANFTAPSPMLGQAPVPIHFENRLAYLRQENKRPAPFLDKASSPEPRDNTEPVAIDAAQLSRFFRDPAHAYLKAAHLVDLEKLRWEETHEDWENLAPNELDKWALRQRILAEWQNHVATGKRPKLVEAALKRKLQLDLTLPPGLAGQRFWEENGQPLLDALARCLQGETLTKSSHSFTYGKITLKTEDWILSDGRKLILVNGDLSKSPKYQLDAYLKHIGAKNGSCILSLKVPTLLEAPPLGEASGETWLQAMLDLYQCGQRSPLPFSMEIASEYVTSLLKELAKNPDLDPPASEPSSVALELARSPGVPSPKAAPGNQGPKPSSAFAPLSPLQATLLSQAYEKKWSAEGGSDDSPAQRLCFNGDSPASPDSELRDAFAAHAERILVPVVSWAQSLKGEPRS